MTTQLISLNEYRKNLSTIWKQAQEKNIKYVVLVHSKPVMEVKPIYNNIIEDDWDTEYTDENHKAWIQARKELAAGETFSIQDLKAKYL